MGDIYLPPSVGVAIAAEAIQQDGDDGVAARERLAGEGARAKQLPKPCGYHMLVAIPESDATYENGLIKADSTRQLEEVATVVGFVVSMGPDCYKDTAKFPTGPWCKEGDFVLIRAYSGTRFKIHGKEWRMLNDDSIEGTVEDPRGITRM